LRQQLGQLEVAHKLRRDHEMRAIPVLPVEPLLATERTEVAHRLQVVATRAIGSGLLHLIVEGVERR